MVVLQYCLLQLQRQEQEAKKRFDDALRDVAETLAKERNDWTQVKQNLEAELSSLSGSVRSQQEAEERLLASSR